MGSVVVIGPVTVQRKLNESNYVVRRGKSKSVVIHVDRMRKLPISSLDGESSVESSDPHMHTSENNEASVCKRRRTQPATDKSSSHTAETVNCSDKGDSISSVDKTADNHSNDINIAINAAAEAMSGSPDTCQTRELASQSTENLEKTHVAPTGQAGRPQPITAGQLKRSHRVPQRYVNTVSLSLIGRLEPRHGVVPRTARACIEPSFATSEAISEDVLSTYCCCCKSCESCTVAMPKRQRHSAPDKDGWQQVVGAGGCKPPARDGDASVGRSTPLGFADGSR